MIRALLLVALLAAPLGAPAATPEAVERAAAQIALAAERLARAEGAENRLAAYGEAVAAYETGLAALRTSLRGLSGRMAALQGDVAARREVLAGVLGILQTIELSPAPTQLLHPAGPLGAARAAMLVADISPALEGELITLQATLSDMEATGDAERAAAELLRTGLAGVQDARAALAAALSERAAPAPPAPAEIAALRAGARSLRAFADTLAAAPATEPGRGFAEARGRLPLPVAGTLARGFGEPDATGLARPGLVFEAAPQTLVVSPWRATLRYAGEFLDYGLIAILEPEDGYLLVLAGLGRVDRIPGEVIEAGEPVGVLGGSQPDNEEFLIDATRGNRTLAPETLYMELRERGEPVDPTPWFRPVPQQEG